MAKRSIKSILIQFLMTMLLFLMSVVALFYVGMNLALNSGVLYPANYPERMASEIAEEIDQQNFSVAQIPGYIHYIELDKEGKIVNQSIASLEEREKLAQMTEAYTSRSTRQYRRIEGEQRTLVLTYRLKADFKSDQLRERLPTAEHIMTVSFLLVIVIGLVLLVRHFAKRIDRELQMILTIKDSIFDQENDYARKNSTIKEIDDILRSLYKMEDKLKKSLRTQWSQREALETTLQAISHDINTPLSIIAGNIELLDETVLDEEQRAYLTHAEKGLERMHSYLKELRYLSGLEVETVQTCVFDEKTISSIETLAKQISTMKQINVSVLEREYEASVDVNKGELMKIIQNLVKNAIDHSRIKTQLTLSFKHVDDRYEIVIEDEGDGFSQVALEKGMDRFFTEHKARNKEHYGLGLFIANELANKNHARLFTENIKKDKKVLGARIRLVFETK
ncbi:sensor histidine kinase [Marinilactibacillus kalidii]|uniref:sensor histidine kinase n=1 Tax=Marinilactibacillus kalidii TaxID=2820274 RepID=UPI001ABEAE8F|nr:HAMP domain-containing sensor histidine kinase [Marinilactibacillus kalidii]